MNETIDVDRDGNPLTYTDVISSEEDLPEEVMRSVEADRALALVRTRLDSRERQIITLRFGLGGVPAMTQREIADKLGISRSYVSRIEKAALDKLKAGFAQRSATGFDVRRLNMLLAVLEKRAGFKLGVKDVFLNMAGGLKVSDPACDLAVVCAVLSSNFDFAIPSDVCFAGEVGLSGEVRPVAQTERRIIEAARLGFRKIYVSSFSGLENVPDNIEVVKVADIPALCRSLFTS